VRSSSCQYPATSHSHWRGVGQHSTGQKPDAKEMCHAAWDKWWSHKILTGFLIHAPTYFLSYLWITDAYLYSQSCEIHRLGPKFQLNDFLNCNSVKIFCSFLEQKRVYDVWATVWFVFYIFTFHLYLVRGVPLRPRFLFWGSPVLQDQIITRALGNTQRKTCKYIYIPQWRCINILNYPKAPMHPTVDYSKDCSIGEGQIN
jgi:hypothetical protein